MNETSSIHYQYHDIDDTEYNLRFLLSRLQSLYSRVDNSFRIRDMHYNMIPS